MGSITDSLLIIKYKTNIENNNSFIYYNVPNTLMNQSHKYFMIKNTNNNREYIPCVLFTNDFKFKKSNFGSNTYEEIVTLLNNQSKYNKFIGKIKNSGMFKINPPPQNQALMDQTIADNNIKVLLDVLFKLNSPFYIKYPNSNSPINYTVKGFSMYNEDSNKYKGIKPTNMNRGFNVYEVKVLLDLEESHKSDKSFIGNKQTNCHYKRENIRKQCNNLPGCSRLQRKLWGTPLNNRGIVGYSPKKRKTIPARANNPINSRRIRGGYKTRKKKIRKFSRMKRKTKRK